MIFSTSQSFPSSVSKNIIYFHLDSATLCENFRIFFKIKIDTNEKKINKTVVDKNLEHINNTTINSNFSSLNDL